MAEPKRPTPEDLQRAAGRELRDVIAPGLDVLFCGINPSLWSAAVGHHFARPGNRFWRAIAAAGFTPRVLDATEDRELLRFGLGVTNLVNRATAKAEELSREELAAGARTLRRKACRHRPRFLAFLGVSAYRIGFDAPRATVGEQPDRICDVRVWVLPNPSGLNAHYQLDGLTAAYADLRRAAETGADGAATSAGTGGGGGGGGSSA